MDSPALELKNPLEKHLEENGYEVQDYGSREGADYPDVVVEAVAAGERDRAILCGGTWHEHAARLAS